LIWDGGATKAKSILENFNQILEKNRIDIEVFSVKDRITNLYFNLLILKVTESQLNLMCNELDKRILEVESGVKSGYLTNSTIDGLKAEKLKLLQNLDAIPAQRKTLMSLIKALTGVEISDSIKLITPNPDELTDLNCKRPELAGFIYQQRVLSASSDLISRKRYPVLASFATAGYGKPGLNMLNNKWDNYFLVGAKLSWNIWDWNTVRKEKQQIKIQDNIVDYRKQTYIDSYQSQIESIILEIQKLKNQLNKDQEIVQLLHQVTERSASALKNGTITSSAFITDFNSESRAKLELELRNIKLSQQKVLLYNISGNELNNK
jgi:outer membrane protein TolC